MSPRSTGKLRSNGACRKCSSIDLNPASISRNGLGPMEIMRDSPMAESYEYRPPTQSQNSNMLAGSIPNWATSSVLVDTATKCLRTALASPRLASSHSLALLALPIVSSVVNVFELTTKRVSAASMSAVASHMSAPSTLDTKRSFSARSENGVRAS